MKGGISSCFYAINSEIGNEFVGVHTLIFNWNIRVGCMLLVIHVNKLYTIGGYLNTK